MDKYVKIHDVIELLQENTIIDGWGNVRLLQSLGETRDQLAKVACDDVAKVIRCKDCGKSIPNTGTGGFIWCDKYAEYVKVNGHCSDGIPKKGG